MSAEVFRHSGKVLGISKCFVWLPNLCCGPGVWGLYSWARHGHIETWAAYKVPLCPFVKTLFLRSNAILVVLNPTRCNLLLPGTPCTWNRSIPEGIWDQSCLPPSPRNGSFQADESHALWINGWTGRTWGVGKTRVSGSWAPCGSCRHCYRVCFLSSWNLYLIQAHSFQHMKKPAMSPSFLWKEPCLTDLIAVFNQNLIPINSIMSCHKKLLEQWPLQSITKEALH